MPNNTRWKKEEEAVLERLYPYIPSTELRDVLPIRSMRAIQSRAVQKGIRKAPEGFSAISRENRLKRASGGDGPKAA